MKIVTAYKSGKSICIRLPKAVVEQMNIAPGTKFKVEWYHNMIVLTKIE